MQALARLEQTQGTRRRGAPRLRLSLDSSLPASGQQVVIHDLSAGGILVESATRLRKGAELEVDLPEIGPTVARVVWNSGDFFGCEFANPIPKAALSAALLRNPFKPAGAPPALVDSSNDEAVELIDDRAPFAVRMRVILGSAVLLWALVLWAAGVI